MEFHDKYLVDWATEGESTWVAFEGETTSDLESVRSEGARARAVDVSVLAKLFSSPDPAGAATPWDAVEMVRANANASAHVATLRNERRIL